MLMRVWTSSVSDYATSLCKRQPTATSYGESLAFFHTMLAIKTGMSI